jgi:anti-sigma factor ChrR (cupin superfamily)
VVLPGLRECVDHVLVLWQRNLQNRGPPRGKLESQEMSDDGINTDYSLRVVVSTNDMDWLPSPSPKVWRKRLERLGGAESGRVTSVVRYDAGAVFPAHDHPEGEEIFVLSGVLSDETGDYPAGTYLLNPEGFRHAPRSEEGCVLFVKLRQYGGSGRDHVVVDTHSAVPNPREIPGVASVSLYTSEAHQEHVRLTRLEPGAAAPRVELPDGEEIFVVEGTLSDEYGDYPAGTWLRLPKGSAHTPRSSGGCLLYVKSGGFPRGRFTAP